jgi:uncharacterized protein YjbJ (UPF0337 family)
MTEHDKADQARKGLIDSVKGKAKEVVGAVTGNNSLTAEGQLEQVQAQERKAANSVEAVADAEAEQARAEAAEARKASLQERVAVESQTAAVERAAQAQSEAQKRAAEQAASQDAARGTVQAEVEAQRKIAEAAREERRESGAAAEELVDAVDDHQALLREASQDKAEADRLRARAEGLTDQADLP